MTALRSLLFRVPFVRPLWVARARRAELDFWRGRRDAIGDGKREWVYTELFGVERDWYRGKRLLDVGCGPRGSLDWATDASARVGVDPLAEAYVRELGADASTMDYVTAVAERLPFAEASFDVIGCVNALDHVRDPRRAAAEMARVLRPGGMLLLVTEFGHETRLTEPHAFGPEVLDLFRPSFAVEDERRLASLPAGMDASLRTGAPYAGRGPGIIAAKLRRSDSPATKPATP